MSCGIGGSQPAGEKWEKEGIPGAGNSLSKYTEARHSLVWDGITSRLSLELKIQWWERKLER